MATKKNGLSLDLIIHPGETIKELLEEKNMTQDELAKILGYSSRSTINKIESDINTLSYDKLLKLVDVFKIDINELINRVDEERKDNIPLVTRR